MGGVAFLTARRLTRSILQPDALSVMKMSGNIVLPCDDCALIYNSYFTNHDYILKVQSFLTHYSPMILQ